MKETSDNACVENDYNEVKRNNRNEEYKLFFLMSLSILTTAIFLPTIILRKNSLKKEYPNLIDLFAMYNAVNVESDHDYFARFIESKKEQT
jgi:hypothetical protein